MKAPSVLALLFACGNRYEPHLPKVPPRGIKSSGNKGCFSASRKGRFTRLICYKRIGSDLRNCALFWRGVPEAQNSSQLRIPDPIFPTRCSGLTEYYYAVSHSAANYSFTPSYRLYHRGRAKFVARPAIQARASES